MLTRPLTKPFITTTANIRLAVSSCIHSTARLSNSSSHLHVIEETLAQTIPHIPQQMYDEILERPFDEDLAQSLSLCNTHNRVHVFSPPFSPSLFEVECVAYCRGRKALQDHRGNYLSFIHVASRASRRFPVISSQYMEEKRVSTNACMHAPIPAKESVGQTLRLRL